MSITSLQLHTAGELVFQCKSCRSILSDSTEFVCTMQSEDGARFVCLRGATDVRVDRIATTTSGPHAAVYFAVCCEQCGTAVGRMYTQAPPALATAASLFCLEDERCLSYELGTADVRAPSQQQQQVQQPWAQQGADGGGLQQQQQQQWAAPPAVGAAGADDRLVLELLQRVEQLEATTCTLQGMLLLQDAQLKGLPGYQGDAAAGAGPA